MDEMRKALKESGGLDLVPPPGLSRSQEIMWKRKMERLQAKQAKQAAVLTAAQPEAEPAPEPEPEQAPE